MSISTWSLGISHLLHPRLLAHLQIPARLAPILVVLAMIHRWMQVEKEAAPESIGDG